MPEVRSQKPIRVASAQGDQLLLQRMQGSERLGRPFEFQLDLLSPSEEIDIDAVLGASMTVELELPTGEFRHFDGKVVRFGLVGRTTSHAHYRAVLRPWLWLLSLTTDCRIWQERTVPEILAEVFEAHGFSDYEDRLRGSYRTWTYCVQYRESAFAFVSRLMEHEGIYYYWEHAMGKHTLVLCDNPGAHQPLPGYEEIPYFPPGESPRGESMQRERDHVFDWQFERRVQPGASELRSFDFVSPQADLDGQHEIQRSHANADFRLFDYEQVYDSAGDGAEYARLRLEERHSEYELGSGHGSARGLAPGHRFELTGHPRPDQNRELLVVAAEYELQNDEFESGLESGGATYDCRFAAIDAGTPFRPARTTPLPRIRGPQTAIVTGAGGDEICTDAHGRVKVRFHWDRHGSGDDKSSCWVRVAQTWAGQGWGAIHVPRVGQEVVVEFLDGDPDRPIVTGRVYNGDNPVPYELPANATQSGIKSRSSKGGGAADFNEIRFEDKKGEEHMYLHAQKDQMTVVENDQAIAVGRDRSEQIDRDRSLVVQRDKTETVQRHKSTTVGGNHSESVQGAMSITVAKTLSENVLINYAETVGGAKESTVGGLLAITVGAAMITSVGAKATESVGGSKSTNVGGSESHVVGGDLSETLGKNHTVKIGKDRTEEVGGKQELKVAEELIVQAKKVQLVAQDEMSLKVGSAEITLKKSGDILIKGKKIHVKGSADVIIKGSKVTEN